MADSENTTHSEDLVVVGSSAGGVGALSTLVSTLSKNFPAPIVLAQHLDPQRPSHLGAILDRRSALPIVEVDEHKPTRLEGGKIYVVPANKHVMIADGHVRLESDHAERPTPSVDKLLSSAAASYGEHLIAVILTGSGSDGAAGAVDVKNAGGVVIIQNPETAPYPSMPLSLPPTVVDHVVEMEQIGPFLYDLLRGVSLPSEEKVEDPLRDILIQVSAHTNIDFHNYKSSTILRRIARRMAVTHISNLRDYHDYLRLHPDEVQELVKAFLIKVTGFFRDREAFDFIKHTVLPELIDRAKDGRILRMWSAGCATGEEAYTMALLIADELGPDFPEWSVRIFATDIADDAINFARRGLYPENVLNELPDDYRGRFFERIDSGYRISKLLRETVIFGQQDISRGVPFPRIDLVVCRNLLIYLKPDLQQTVLDLFAYSLHQSNGYLFLGKAETARPTKASFELVNKKWKIYRCLGGPLSFPTHAETHTTLLSDARRETRLRAPAGGPLVYDQSAIETDVAQLRRVNETILRYLTAGVVVIDRNYRIITLNAAARRLFGIRDLAHDQDFLHTVRGMPYHDVRSAIDLAFREHTGSTLEALELDQTVVGVGSGRYIDVTIMTMQVEAGAPEFAMITAVDTTEAVQLKKRLEAVQREQADLVGELSATNKRFADMNKELQDANEELQAANEELMLTQEELQATNEEFEATNEELQATNEELETNNEELQATNEELQTTNDELTARTIELHHLTQERGAEQFRLSELLERFPYYVMVVGASDLRIQAVNPGYALLLGKQNVIGQPVADFFGGEDLEKLIAVLSEVATEGKPITTQPMAVRATRDGEHTEDLYVHSVIPILRSQGGPIERLFIYTEKA